MAVKKGFKKQNEKLADEIERVKEIVNEDEDEDDGDWESENMIENK
jgi:hypothetical protein